MKDVNLNIIILIITLALLPSCTNANVHKIAYMVGTPNYDGANIFLMNEDGSNTKMLNTGLTNNGCPLWSPDGKKLLFISDNGEFISGRKVDLYIINQDGSGLKKITNGNMVIYSADWSPNGDKIVFSAGSNNGYRPINLYTMNSDGSNIKQITFSEGQESNIYPNWSSNGESIVFSSKEPVEWRQDNENFLLYVLNLNTREVNPITFTKEGDQYWLDFGANWSPDGEKILFYSDDRTSGQLSKIQVIDINTNSMIEVGSSPGYQNLSPRWSPDGTQIVFTSNRDAINEGGYSDVYVMSENGTNVKRLTSTGNNYCPDWQP